MPDDNSNARMAYDYDDEIDLMDYIKVIVRRRKIILTIFILCVTATAVISLLMPKVYQSSALIMFMNKSPKDSLSAQKELLKSNAVLENIVKRLKLTDSSGKPAGPLDIFSKLKAEKVRKGNLIRLKAQDSDPGIAQKLADTWAEEYIKYSQKLIESPNNFLIGQFENAKRNLSQAEDKIRNFKNKYSIDLMQADLSMKKNKLNSGRKELMNLELSLKDKKDYLKELQGEIKKQDKFIILSKAITDNALWQRENSRRGGDISNKKLKGGDINLIYQDVKTLLITAEIDFDTSITKIAYLKESIPLLEKEINKLEKEVNQRQSELTWLTRQRSIYQHTYNNLLSKIENMRAVKTKVIGIAKEVSSPARPKFPIKPKKRMMVLLSAVLGLMLGIFIAFFVEYWQRSEEKNIEEAKKKTKSNSSEE